MTILYLNIITVYILGYLTRYFSSVKLTNQNLLFSLPNKLLTIFIISLLVMVSGLRSNIGDTEAYMHAYRLDILNWGNIDYSDEFGFQIYQLLLKEISQDPQLLVFVSALITNVLIILTLYKYCEHFDLGVFVYIASGMFLVSMNGIRQFIAAGLFFIATKFLIEGKWKSYVLIILLASTIHKSALILIPIYFIVRRKAWTKSTLILLFTSILMIGAYNEFSSVLFKAIENTKYGHYSNFSEGGANILRVIVGGVPLILAFLGREKLRLRIPYSDYVVNMGVIGLIILIISTQNWIFARFNIYFGLYNLILISWIVSLFHSRQRRFIYYSIWVCYFIFFIFEHTVLGIDYRSNYLNL
jgi:transmembrane protein EpsG